MESEVVSESDATDSIVLKRKQRAFVLKKFIDSQKADEADENLEWEFNEEEEVKDGREGESYGEDDSEEDEDSEDFDDYQHTAVQKKTTTKDAPIKPDLNKRKINGSFGSMDEMWARMFGMLVNNMFCPTKCCYPCYPSCYPTRCDYPQYEYPCNPCPPPRRPALPCSSSKSGSSSRKSRRSKHRSRSSRSYNDSCYTNSCSADQCYPLNCCTAPDPCLSICKPNPAGGISFSLPGKIQHKTTIKVAHFPKPVQDVSFFSSNGPQEGLNNFSGIVSGLQNQMPVPNMEIPFMQDQCQQLNPDVQYVDENIYCPSNSMLQNPPGQTMVDECGNVYIYEY